MVPGMAANRPAAMPARVRCAATCDATESVANKARSNSGAPVQKREGKRNEGRVKWMSFEAARLLTTAAGRSARECEHLADMAEFSDRLMGELIDAVKVPEKRTIRRLRDVYLIGDIDKDTARTAIERMRELANEGQRTDHALHQQRGRQRHRRPGASRRNPGARAPGDRGLSSCRAWRINGFVVLQAASPGRRCFRIRGS